MSKAETFYKVVRPDLTSFHDSTFQYEIGKRARRRPDLLGRRSGPELCSTSLLHASRTPEQAARYGQWPWRLLEVTGVPVVEDHQKAGFRQLTVTRELPVEQSFGPSGAKVLEVLADIDRITDWAAAWAILIAAEAAACHHLIGDVFTQEHYDTLMAPWRAAVEAGTKEDA